MQVPRARESLNANECRCWGWKPGLRVDSDTGVGPGWASLQSSADWLRDRAPTRVWPDALWHLKGADSSHGTAVKYDWEPKSPGLSDTLGPEKKFVATWLCQLPGAFFPLLVQHTSPCSARPFLARSPRLQEAPPVVSTQSLSTWG